MLSTMQDGHLSIATLLRHGAKVHATATVTTWAGTEGRTASFAEVGTQAAKLANALRALGVDGDQRVATFMWNNQEHLTAYLAVPAMGAVLHTLNVRLFPEQLTYIVNHAEDHAIIVDASIAPLLSKILPGCPTVQHVIVANGPTDAVTAPDHITVHSYADLLDNASGEFDWPEVDERAAAAMCYTSGTTGNPKGVVYSHRSIWLHSMQVCMPDGMQISSADRTLVIVPQFHAMSWGIPYAAFMTGASLIMPDRFLQPEPLARMIATLKPTQSAAVPTIWQGVLSYLDQNPVDLSSLREVVVGGAACPPAMMHAFSEKYGLYIVHAWGMTETSPLGTLSRPPVEISEEETWRYRYTQGRLPAGVSARLVGDDGREVPWDGESVGELEVRGPWIAGAYYKPEPEDAAKFVDGWLRTGDVGTLTPDGFLTLTDRSKDIIKSGGEWISSVELENHVMAHPAVAEAAVIGIPDPRWDERPLVSVVLRPGATATAEELREFLGTKVAKWQLPENWTFVAEVPKTSVGKFDKKVLRAAHAHGELDVKHLD
ncbi:long-chain fatty acid--CoA ligase [Actinokineospora globicatena]|uniref:long-chain fatty acid--CoA ligase n=1 Tax=Actinokineospora globicatena TaxID=103729 RepID=UPI0020A351D2|nr:long-chain fatty acid--CoA ligase [Actinokineospora globicatena]MCP2300719.1 fatty-acyl-CoA synthase [Actinokineospora globicatena]GLW77656.1 fatty-acyl-CoA synthase [Actinokineospora globicatena]GLW84492.1 fatty-acyl-CoA synthase [Actinokineospora globicatena]